MNYLLWSTKIHAGKDENFTLGQYHVTLPAELTRVPFIIPIINDNIVEVNEKFDIIIDQSSLPLNVYVGNNYQTTVMIVDDDGE